MLIKFHLGIIFLITFFFSTCKKESANNNVYRKSTPLLELNGQFLYMEDLPLSSSLRLSPEDSTALIDSYIKRWVIDVLVYEHAKKNITEPQEIDRLVEEYRKILTIQNYQQLLVTQRLPQPTEDQIAEFYSKYSSQFLLEDNIIKGVLMKVPKKAPKKGDVRRWMKEIDDEKNLEKMEKYSVRNYATLDYFQDHWLFFSDVLKKIPLSTSGEKNFLKTNSFIEVEDSVYSYMLSISEYKLQGEVEPIDFAKEKIRNILLNQQKIEFIHRFEEELYQDAKKNIKLFKEEKSNSLP